MLWTCIGIMKPIQIAIEIITKKSGNCVAIVYWTLSLCLTALVLYFATVFIQANFIRWVLLHLKMILFDFIIWDFVLGIPIFNFCHT